MTRALTEKGFMKKNVETLKIGSFKEKPVNDADETCTRKELGRQGMHANIVLELDCKSQKEILCC